MQIRITSRLVTYGLLGLVAGLSFVLPGRLAPVPVRGQGGGTAIDEVVMYAVDADTNQVLRYGFDSSEYRVIGTVIDQHGNVVEDIESLAYIPDGDHKGVYTSPQDGPYANHLVRVSLINGSGVVFPDDIGFGDVTGMIARADPDTGRWVIWATTQTDKLITIDPATGRGTVVHDLGRAYEGLAVGPDGTWYGALERELWRIDPTTGSESRIGEHAYGRVESLEYAHGDDDPGIHIPGVPASWTADGVLFAFSDDSDTLLVMNPATGDAMAWDTPVVTPDAEGIIFVTKRSDPVYRVIVAPFD